MEQHTPSALERLQARIGDPEFDTPSPFGRWLRGKLLRAEAGSLEAEYAFRPEMANPAGTLHGGVIAAMFDDLMGATMYSLGSPEFMSSINLVVDFLAPVHAGESVIVTTGVTKEGRQLMHAQAQMRNGNGKLVAVASSNLIRTGAMIGGKG